MAIANIDILRAMHTFYDGHPERHTVGWFARDTDDNSVDTFSDKATSFCLSGNCQRALVKDFDITGGPFYDRQDAIDALLNKAAKAVYGLGNYINMQDDFGYEGAMAILNKAIELEQAACAASA